MKYLIWDFDNTLAFRKGGWSSTLYTLVDRIYPGQYRLDQISPFLQTGFPWHTPDIINPANRSSDDWWKCLQPLFINAFNRIGIENNFSKELLEQVKNEYIDVNNWDIYPDTKPVLDQLCSEGWLNLILSNHVPELNQIVTNLGLFHYFDNIFNSAKTGIEKPNIKAFQNVIKTIKNIDSIWMIGDSYTADIKGAESVGIPAILVRNKNNQAKWNIDSLSDVIKILK